MRAKQHVEKRLKIVPESRYSAAAWKIVAPLVLCLAFLTGCRVPAQMAWSPDGSLAAYRVEDKAYVIDSAGKVAAPLGSSAGGFAWTADSRTLYFASATDTSPGALTTIETRWESPTKQTDPDAEEMDLPTTQPTSQPSRETSYVQLQSFAGGRVSPIASFEAGPVFQMALSPDQQWLAVVCDTDASATFAVYAYHLPSKHLYRLSNFAGFGMCFTGPDRLAYIEPDRLGDKAEAMTGKIVEVTLNATANTLERKPLLDVIPSQTPYIAALGENLLLTSVARTFPGKPIDDDDKLVCKLFQWTRANCGIVALADDVGPLFSISPDGQHVLIEKLTPKTDQMPAKRELELIRANGSDGHTLRDLSQRTGFALWPAWHGNSEITFTSREEDAKPVKVNKEQRVQYDVVQYKLNDKMGLEPIRTLSESWDNAMKPYIAIDPQFITEPTTEPATQPTTKP